MEHITKKKFAIATVAVMVVMLTGIITASPAFASSEKPTFHHVCSYCSLHDTAAGGCLCIRRADG